MEQLLLHLIGDYVTQTNWMANGKTKSWWPAFVHAFVYALPFFLLTSSMPALFLILVSHYAIDRYRVARYLIFFKNWLNEPSIKWEECNRTGYQNNAPEYITFWLMIIFDNTMHLTINYAAITWL